MEELLKNETVRQKIKQLSPEIRRGFIESLLDLFEQETEDMIDAIEESRMELRGTMLDFEDETEQLRAESRMLEQQRTAYERQCVDDYIEKKGRKSQASRASSRVSYVNERDAERNREAVLNYIRKKEGRKQGGDSSRISSSLSVPSVNIPDDRPISVLSSRSLPTPVMSRKTIEEETNEIMSNFTSVDMKMEKERHRQAELLEKKRQEKAKNRKTTEEKALELLEKALYIDKQLAVRKEQQNQKLQERLEEMKKKKEEERSKSRAVDSRVEHQFDNAAYEQDVVIEKY